MNENDWMCRTELLARREGLEKLKQANVLVVGLGGVGGYAAEQLVRSGIGKLTLIDNDTVHPSNKNRQLIALDSTIDKFKTDSFKERFYDINPDAKISVNNLFVEEDIAKELIEKGNYDYVVDAIDTLTPKVDLLEACIRNATRVVSSFGSGARMDPSKIEIAEIEDSHHCKFGYLVRKRLHGRKIYKGIKVVFSSERSAKHAMVPTDGSNHKKSIVGTVSYMPALFGCYAASVVIRDLLKD
jgi:tRNA A37 threonylcarbamoyladenosine dehydratase